MPEPAVLPCKPAYRTISIVQADDSSTSLLLLENPLEVHFLNIAEDMYGGVFIDNVLELTTRMTLDFVEQPSFFRNPFKKSLTMPLMRGKLLPVDTKAVEGTVLYDPFSREALLIQYHLRILEKLLLWCMENRTATLLLIFGDDTIEYLEVYRKFTTSRSLFQRYGLRETRCAIPATAIILDQVIKSLHLHEQAMRQMLWKEQRGNWVLREYLKANAL